jgi:hypothetical protein
MKKYNDILTYRRHFIIPIILLFAMNLYSQNFKGRTKVGKDFANIQIKRSTNDSSKYNICDKNKLLLPDKKAVIEYSEIYLLEYDDKDKINNQKPFEIYLIDNYWYVRGTMKTGAFGENVTLIINAVGKKIIREHYTKLNHFIKRTT